MSEAKFTKGPWFCDSYMEIDGSVRVMHGNITITYHGAANDQDIANANLIASAPEMYEFLESLQLDVTNDYKRDEILAKARGEQND